MKGGGSFPSSLIMYVMIMREKGRIGLGGGGPNSLPLSTLVYVFSVMNGSREDD